jgi:uncharacterized oligopeptide transporter (OPT) family protein
MFFAIPLRKFYILKLKLVYPSAVATAFTIRSLHVGYGLRLSIVAAPDDATGRTLN